MTVETLAELCMRSVVDNFDKNGAIIDIYDLGNKACADIIDQLWCANKINDNTVDRLQVHGIETLKFNEPIPDAWTNKLSRWLVDVVAAGLEELSIECEDFDGTIANTIVDKYEKKKPAPTSRNSSSELEEDMQSSGVVPTLHTLCIETYATDLDNLPSMLSIFAGTLKGLMIMCNYFTASKQKTHRLFDVIGTLCLDKLWLHGYLLSETRSLVITQSMQHLQTLKLEDMDDLTDQHVLSFLEVAGHSLQHLCVRFPSRSSSITDSTLQYIKLYCPNLVRLELSCNDNLTTAGLEHFFETASLTKLQILDLYCNNSVTDAVVAKIAAATVSGQLSYIDIRWCHEITNQSLQALANMPKLEYVTLTSKLLDNKDVEKFMTRHNLKDCNVYDELSEEW